ncbi:MAG: hypothetical protein JO348_02890 [Alphaproteobacteria bacterium]|nr:hypothetical protein [Alphaproteobacteria bacterium]MBV9418698.1 hypothetical protein [Alphaproteobacteria bacterium]MBV9541103.1 hypothetical protein [Alphaproteobacteria bacterium]
MMLLIAASLLLLATVGAWFVALGAKPAARVQLRFAMVLFACIAISAALLPPASASVTLLVLPIALSVVAFASAAGFEHAAPASLSAPLLAAVSLGGMAAAATGIALFSLAPAALAACALAAVSVRQFDAARASSVQGMLAALAFLAALSTFVLEGVGFTLLLFVATGVLGGTLALSRSDARVEKKRGRDLRTMVSPSGGA